MTSAPPSRPRQLAGYVALGFAAVFAIGAGVYFFLLAPDEAAAPGSPALPTVYPNTGPLVPDRPEIGKPAPDFALVDARDTSVVRTLSDFRGKVLLLNWYASWCDPCRREIPAFLAAREALGGQLEILGIDYLEPPEKAVGILDELGADYPALLDANGSVASHYRIPGMPTTFLIAPDGTLLAMRAGELREAELADFLAKAGLEYRPN
ncbi:TlpA disulfide reductase family protein [Tepidiforma flava]|uniref:TlpA disulfide reductase family protein n=1 Tax=Tepidiforma flava TaxID=3004094 RepID=A0ABY7M8Z9_9CHLR|nr:TlpA disulfide reductase family protein [Tepidiforma flava]WBL36980.1 TlpA disulfide reductase family protein [Tepidiforma flava]